MSEMRKLCRRGNTLGVVIPAAYLKRLGWGAGEWIEFLIEGRQIVLRNLKQWAGVPPGEAAVEKELRRAEKA